MAVDAPGKRTAGTLLRAAAPALLLAWPMLATLAGCASPNPNLFTLAALPGTPQTANVRSIELRRVALAGYLDRPEIVRSDVQFRLQVSSTDRWGEPMGTMLDRVFTEDLVQRLPGTSVFTEAGAISTRPDVVLEVDVQRLDSDASGSVVLLAQVAIQHEDAARSAAATEVRLTIRPASGRTTDLVAAMSTVLGQFADVVARKLAPSGSRASVSREPPANQKHGHGKRHHLSKRV